jgi:hypothetical protein
MTPRLGSTLYEVKRIVDRYELERVLKTAGVNPMSYSVWGDHRFENWVLAQLPHGRWSVYYCERGEETGTCYFPSEDAACRYLLDRLKRSHPKLLFPADST